MYHQWQIYGSSEKTKHTQKKSGDDDIYTIDTPIPPCWETSQTANYEIMTEGFPEISVKICVIVQSLIKMVERRIIKMTDSKKKETKC